MIACQYGLESVVEYILKFRPDVLLRNRQFHNCLELAIRRKNKHVVNYLIESEHLFPLMRNAQLKNCRCCKGDSTKFDFNQSSSTCCCIPCGTGINPYKDSCLKRCCMTCKADTPMRKLITSMPDMAYKVLDRCTTELGADETKLHQKSFNYEFLEDQFTIHKWAKGKITHV